MPSEVESRPENAKRDKLAEIAGGEPAGEREPRMPRGRRAARAAAVQALYEADMTGHPVRASGDRLVAAADISAENAEIASAIIGHVEKHRAELDARIATAATAFPVAQIGAVERNVLRAALAEAEARPGTPKGVIVSEAVEIARLFGGESSPSFVNAVLGALLG